MHSSTGGEVKDFFGEETISNLHSLFKILDNEDYETEDEMNALLFEVVQYIAIFQHHLPKITKPFLEQGVALSEWSQGRFVGEPG